MALAPEWPVYSSNFPLNFDDFVEALVSTGLGGIEGQYWRDSVLVPAASGGTAGSAALKISVPSGAGAILIYRRDLYMDNYTSDVTVTANNDTQSNFLSDIPMIASLTLTGAFQGIITSGTTFTLTNNGSVDSTFFVDSQVLILTPDNLQTIVQPVLDLNSQIVQGIANFAVKQGV